MDETPSGTTASSEADWVICCSGGGIRSATYCLGALQSLARGLYPRAKWIVGVSGGSYIAASLSLVRHGLAGSDAGAAYEPGSAEEQHLRDNTRYIAPDAKTALVGVLSLLLGVVVTFTLVMAPVYALSHLWGWLLRSQSILTWTRGRGASASVTAWSWWLAPAVAAGLTLVLFTYWWATLPTRGADRGAQRARWTGWAAFITAVLALAMLAAPPVLAWLYHSTGAVGVIVHAIGFGGPGHWTFGTLTGLAAALIAVAGWCRAQLAKVKAAQTQQNPAGSTGLATTVAQLAVSRLTPWLASAVVVAIGAVAALTWTGSAARTGYTRGQLVPVAVAVAVMLATRAVADFNRLSLHDVYRWRLATAYAVTRSACEQTDPGQRLERLAEAARTRLSDLTKDQTGLVICTTANINASGDVRPGQGGYCLAWDAQQATLRGAPGSAASCQTARTVDYENLTGLTLFDLVAISGAAVSPLMGSATKVAYRILLTATNVRLGVWLPHPRVVSNAREYLAGTRFPEQDRWWARQPMLLLAWYVLPHPRWHASQERKDRSEAREARLWAHVLQAREAATRDGRRRLGALLRWRVMQPTMGLLWSEAAGHTSYRATWINVTDGGHYDNLGMVEALRRDPARVLVLDASGDHVGTWSTLGGSMALARMDASVDIDLKPDSMMEPNKLQEPVKLAGGQVIRPWAAGMFQPRSAANGLTDRNLWVCKLGWWQAAPWDVVAYARNHPSYPCEPTLQQLYDSSEFEAYRELGAQAVAVATSDGKLPNT